MDISLTQQEKQYIGKWIRWKRKENKLSQEEFLEAYPLCARKTLSRIENGKENVRPELLEDLLSVFGMRIPEVSDFQSVFSRSEWERLSRAYDLYDESLLQSCIRSMQKKLWYYVKFEDNLNFCFLTNPKKFVPLSIDYGSLSLRTHFLLLFKLPALAAA